MINLKEHIQTVRRWRECSICKESRRCILFKTLSMIDCGPTFEEWIGWYIYYACEDCHDAPNGIDVRCVTEDELTVWKKEMGYA